jgi:hypothetical protein
MDELVRIKSHTDDEGKHYLLLIVGGLIFATQCESKEQAYAIGLHTFETLLRFQRSTAIGVADHAGTVLAKPDGNGN